jgi:hypothetical protein
MAGALKITESTHNPTEAIFRFVLRSILYLFVAGEEIYFGAQFGREKFVGVDDLDFHLESAFLTIGFGRFLGHVAVVNVIGVGFGADFAFLVEIDFGDVGFV